MTRMLLRAHRRSLGHRWCSSAAVTRARSDLSLQLARAPFDSALYLSRACARTETVALVRRAARCYNGKGA